MATKPPSIHFKTLAEVQRTQLDGLGVGITPLAVTDYPSNFEVQDQTTSMVYLQNGIGYREGLPFIHSQLLVTTDDDINVTSYLANTLIIVTGTGTDAINVSVAGGNNILDDSAGSDFLTGGTGNDVFYVDDRQPGQNLWSTLANFHSGDLATVWGVTPADFTLTWLANEGAPGFTGLTAVFTEPGHPSAAVTLVGYTRADLTNGRLSVSYNRTADEPGLPGSSYMQISAH